MQRPKRWCILYTDNLRTWKDSFSPGYLRNLTGWGYQSHHDSGGDSNDHDVLSDLQ